MADDINKKISIDIEINTDGQQQIDQYKASFDNLRNTINNIIRVLVNYNMLSLFIMLFKYPLENMVPMM